MEKWKKKDRKYKKELLDRLFSFSIFVWLSKGKKAGKKELLSLCCTTGKKGKIKKPHIIVFFFLWRLRLLFADYGTGFFFCSDLKISLRYSREYHSDLQVSLSYWYAIWNTFNKGNYTRTEIFCCLSWIL